MTEARRSRAHAAAGRSTEFPALVGAAADTGQRPGGAPRSSLPGRALTWLRWGVLATPVLLLAVRAWDRRWTTEDGFINLRVVDMVRAGHGPVFNVGERVEVTTSTLWLWVLVAGDAIFPFDLEWVAAILGLAFAIAALVLLLAASSTLHRAVGLAGPAIPLGALVLASLSPVWDFSTAGMEGGLTFAWIGGVALVLARWVDGGETLSVAGALLIGLGPLVRPDLAVVTVIALASVLALQWRGDGWRTRMATLAAALAIPMAYQVFRMGYFAALVPNTALAKGAERPRWDAGWAYVVDLVAPYALVVPLAAVLGIGGTLLVRSAVRAGGRAMVAVLALPVAGLLHAAYVVRAGGDYLHGRLLLPSLWALLAPLAVVPLPRIVRRPRARDVAMVITVATVVAWAVISTGWLRKTDIRMAADTFIVDGRRVATWSSDHSHPVTVADRGWGADSPLRNLPTADIYVNGEPLGATPRPDLPTPVYVTFGVGISGYTLGPDYYVLDLAGLGDPVASRLRITRPAMIAHEKLLPAPWLAARLSDEPIDQAALPSDAMLAPALYTSPADQFADDVAAARAALDCAALTELFEAVRDPMSPRRFMDNLLASPGLTRLRIDPAPMDAAADLCD